MKASRYALATLRTLGSTATFEDSDFGILIDEAVEKLEAEQDADDKILELFICEVPYLILKPDRLYRFSVQKDCEKCQRSAKEAR